MLILTFVSDFVSGKAYGESRVNSVMASIVAKTSLAQETIVNYLKIMYNLNRICLRDTGFVMFTLEGRQ